MKSSATHKCLLHFHNFGKSSLCLMMMMLDLKSLVYEIALMIGQ